MLSESSLSHASLLQCLSRSGWSRLWIYMVDTKWHQHSIPFCPPHSCSLASTGTMVHVGWAHGEIRRPSRFRQVNYDVRTSSITPQGACVQHSHDTWVLCGLRTQATSSNGDRNIRVLGMHSGQTGLAHRRLRWMQETVIAPLSALTHIAHLPAYAMQ